MGILDDILSGAGSAADFIENNTALGTHVQRANRMGEIGELASSQGYPSPMHPRFQRENPEIAEEYNALAQASTSFQTSSGVAAGALGAARGAGARSLPPPRAATGEVIPPPKPPPSSPPPGTGSFVEGASRPVTPPTTPPPGSGALPSPASAATPSAHSGLLARAAEAIKNNPSKAGVILAGVLAVVSGSGMGAVDQAGVPDVIASTGRPKDPTYGPPLSQAGPDPAVVKAEAEAEDKKRREKEEEARVARTRNADVSLTEAQAGHYAAERDRALRAMQNDDMTESAKQDIAHRHAMIEVAARAQADLEREMVSQAGANERTNITEAGANRRADQTDVTQRRGQDQQAQDSMARFVNSFILNQVETGKYSLDKANKVFEAYIKTQKLPSEILETVSKAISPMLPYMRGNSTGEQPTGYESGGSASRLAAAAGGKYRPPTRVKNDFNLQDLGAKYGAVPNAEPMPSVREIFSAAPDIPMPDQATVTRAAGMYPGGPQAQPLAPTNSPDNYSSPMPPELQQNIMGGLR